MAADTPPCIIHARSFFWRAFRQIEDCFHQGKGAALWKSQSDGQVWNKPFQEIRRIEPSVFPDLETVALDGGHSVIPHANLKRAQV